MNDWLKWTKHYDLSGSRGNGPFDSRHPFLGVVLHVNESENGTSPEWFASGESVNQYSVTPNFQVMKDGTTYQLLPLLDQPWCQIDGNFNYAAIETAGLHSEPLTDAQIEACARIVAAYGRHAGLSFALADKPGDKGLGTHAMGGTPWGGHPCPGDIRTGQRAAIIERAEAITDVGVQSTPTPPPQLEPHHGPVYQHPHWRAKHIQARIDRLKKKLRRLLAAA